MRCYTPNLFSSNIIGGGMSPSIYRLPVLALSLWLFACSPGDSDQPTLPSPAAPVAPSVTVIDLSADQAAFVDQSGSVEDYNQTRADCESRGWTKSLLDVEVGQTRYTRKVLHKAPTSPSWRGALILMHGGSSNYANWCNANVTARGQMVNAALDNEFAVFLLDSTDIVTDQFDSVCGKIWDDNVLDRDNLDVPYISQVITDFIPQFRPSGDPANIFLMGFSSGGFMATRAASQLNNLVTGFIPVATASPYGWFRDCSFLVGRDLVAGIGRDNDTSIAITELNACGPTEFDPTAVYPNEVTWQDGGVAIRPSYLKVQHFYDAIVDFSCHTRHIHQLGENGYNGTSFELRPDSESRSQLHHRFLPELIAPIINYLLSNT